MPKPPETGASLKYPTKPEITRALRTFKPGAAAGIDPLTPDLLIELIEAPTSTVLDGLVPLLGRLIQGWRADGIAQQLLFGANVTALNKKGGGIRPIAAGHVLRRLVAKIMLQRNSKVIQEYMVARDQFGVGVRSGCESVAFAVSRLAASIPKDDNDMVIFRSDFVNAFNRIARAIMLQEVYRVIPALAPLAHSAYGDHSMLKFGRQSLLSQQGVQQGDPFGPLFFSLALAKMWEEIKSVAGPEVSDRLFAAWIMDDGVFMAPLADISVIIDAMLSLGPKYGLQLNLSKCELIGWKVPDSFWPAITSRKHPDNFTHLGVCCGSQIAREEFAAKLIAKMRLQLGAYDKVSVKDPMAAFTLLRMCSHRAALNYFTRVMGPLKAWSEADTAMLDWFNRCICELPETKFQRQLQLPIRFGGFGLPLIQQLAPLAHFACTLAAREQFPSRVSLAPAASLIASPVLAPFPSVTSLMKTFLTQDGPLDVIADAVAASDETIAEDEEEPSKDTGVTDGTHATPLPPSESGSLSLQVCEDVEPRAVPTNTQRPHSTPKVKRVNIQHVLSSQLQLCNRTNLVESFTDTKDKARLMCLTAKTTGMWLCPTKHTSRDGIWIRSPDTFRTAARLRLGAAVTHKAEPCLKCQAKGTSNAQVPRDVFGHHTVCCMIGGDRCRLHNAVCRQLVKDATYGLLHPGRETHPFGDGQRLDFTFVMPKVGTELLVDVALTFPLRADSIAAAMAKAGGAATSYEAVKQRTYGHRLGPRQKLVPLIFDTFGGAGESGIALLNLIAVAYTRRRGSRSGRAIFFSRLNTLIVSSVAAAVRSCA